MSKLITPIKNFILELVIILVFYFFVPSFAPEIITGDGKGYYDYLPSVFIHHDFARTNLSDEEIADFHERTDKFGFYTEVGEYQVNRYPCGTAVLELPFFITTRLLTDMDNKLEDGYQPSFHRAVYFAALFYLFLTLLFFKGLLILYDLRKSVILFTQILLVFATAITQYASSNAAFSHVYSLFAITAFLYFSKRYFKERSEKSFLFAALFFGLVVILRNVNVLVILILPFLAGSWEVLIDGFLAIFKKPLLLFQGILVCFLVLFIQMLAWYLQSGNWLVYSYEGYGFNFFDPKLVEILFSYRKGLFVYTPVLFVGLVGVFYWGSKKNYFLFFSWLFFFLMLTYVLSSWEFWFYGDSYGLRAYVDFYTVFFIPFAILIQNVGLVWQLLIILLSGLTIPLNLIQNYQYQKYILHHSQMNREGYWKVFLKTDERFNGIFYRKRIDAESNTKVADYTLGDINIKPHVEELIWEMNGDDFVKLDSVKFIQVEFWNDFNEDDWTSLALTIDDEKGKNHLYHRPYLQQFATEDFGHEQLGSYTYQLSEIENMDRSKIRLILCTKDRPCKLKEVHVRLFSQNQNRLFIPPENY